MSSRRSKPGKRIVPAAGPKAHSAPRTPGPDLSAQTRKILLKHYRTKYGVRGRGGK